MVNVSDRIETTKIAINRHTNYILTMTDNVTSELILEHLKAIQGKITRVEDRMGNIEMDIRIIKGHMASYMQSETKQDGAIATLQARLERIEKRLELSE